MTLLASTLREHVDEKIAQDLLSGLYELGGLSAVSMFARHRGASRYAHINKGTLHHEHPATVITREA